MIVITMMHYWNGWGAGYGNSMAYGGPFMDALAWLGPLFIIAIFWSFFWKGLALWHSARRGQYWWFLILLVVNTVGILEIIYLFAVAKLKFDQLFKVHVRGEQ